MFGVRIDDPQSIGYTDSTVECVGTGDSDAEVLGTCIRMCTSHGHNVDSRTI